MLIYFLFILVMIFKAIRLPTAYSNEKGINSLFKIFGEINSIRMLEAGKDVPSDLKNYATQVKDIGEFKTY